VTEVRRIGYIQRCGPATGGGELRSVFPIKWHVNVSPRVQEGLPEGATLIPIILGSDKTRLTMLSGNKEAWPVYMSIGNIQHQGTLRKLDLYPKNMTICGI
jgi:hypothetical protein